MLVVNRGHFFLAGQNIARVEGVLLLKQNLKKKKKKNFVLLVMNMIVPAYT